MSSLTRCLIVVWVAILTFGSSVSVAGDNDGASTLKSKDGMLTAILPDGWEQTTIKDSAGKLQAKCADKAAYLNVTSVVKSDVTFKDLKAYAERCREAASKSTKLEDVVQTSLESVTINGRAGYRFTLTGTYKQVKYYYTKTYVETDHDYLTVSCWTTPSHKDDSVADFDFLAAHLSEASAGK